MKQKYINLTIWIAFD